MTLGPLKPLSPVGWTTQSLGRGHRYPGPRLCDRFPAMSAPISRRQFLATAGTLPLAARLFAAHADVPSASSSIRFAISLRRI